MSQKISYLAVALLGTVTTLVSVSSAACSLQPTDPVRIKQMMAKEIAFRLGTSPQRIPLAAISQPELHTPYPLGADCSGLATYHHSAGFRLGEVSQSESRPRPWPHPRPWPYPFPYPPPSSGTQCSFEGVAVVLGYGYSSPVAVHFERKCRVP
ncbi:hypothetical protein N0K08_18775 [Acidovorax sp. Be4]|uniref:Lipoprotein n=1 Tax=Acidovorax bellezanensis TaxID=2976702 RepID=A0ABT2PQD6_9BURK|nr:hypothetical protein [Acidovorax sp. Be4]MCT9812680.1 hypothetical protein [Acidovorax sp. Be4]